jgi:phosphoribosylaminoimidazole carboxylase (NCAIR synthetase)
LHRTGTSAVKFQDFQNFFAKSQNTSENSQVGGLQLLQLCYAFKKKKKKKKIAEKTVKYFQYRSLVALNFFSLAEQLLSDLCIKPHNDGKFTLATRKNNKHAINAFTGIIYASADTCEHLTHDNDVPVN